MTSMTPSVELQGMSLAERSGTIYSPDDGPAPAPTGITSPSGTSASHSATAPRFTEFEEEIIGGATPTTSTTNGSGGSLPSSGSFSIADGTIGAGVIIGGGSTGTQAAARTSSVSTSLNGTTTSSTSSAASCTIVSASSLQTASFVPTESSGSTASTPGAAHPATPLGSPSLQTREQLVVGTSPASSLQTREQLVVGTSPASSSTSPYIENSRGPNHRTTRTTPGRVVSKEEAVLVTGGEAANEKDNDEGFQQEQYYHTAGGGGAGSVIEMQAMATTAAEATNGVAEKGAQLPPLALAATSSAITAITSNAASSSVEEQSLKEQEYCSDANYFHLCRVNDFPLLLSSLQSESEPRLKRLGKARDPEGHSLLHWAALFPENLDILRWCIEHLQCDVAAQAQGTDQTPLMWTMTKVHSDPSSWPSLHHATQDQRTPPFFGVRYLVRHSLGPSLRYRDSLGASALLIAIQHGNFMGFLLCLGADLSCADDVDHYGCTVAHWAAFKGEITMLRILIALFDSKLFRRVDSQGMTPLHRAVTGGRHSSVEALMTHAVSKKLLDPHTRSKNGATALDLAKQNADEYMTRIIRRHLAKMEQSLSASLSSRDQSAGSPGDDQELPMSTSSGSAANGDQHNTTLNASNKFWNNTKRCCLSNRFLRVPFSIVTRTWNQAAITGGNGGGAVFNATNRGAGASPTAAALGGSPLGGFFAGTHHSFGGGLMNGDLSALLRIFAIPCGVIASCFSLSWRGKDYSVPFFAFSGLVMKIFWLRWYLSPGPSITRAVPTSNYDASFYSSLVYGPYINTDDTNPASWLHFLIIVGDLVAAYTYLSLVCCDPGTVPKPHPQKRRQAMCRYLSTLQHDENMDPQTAFRFCDTCFIVRDLRTKHCRVCDVCVHDFDHHCLWLNNCVGRANHRTFLVFCVSLTSSLVMFALKILVFFFEWGVFGGVGALDGVDGHMQSINRGTTRTSSTGALQAHSSGGGGLLSDREMLLESLGRTDSAVSTEALIGEGSLSSGVDSLPSATSTSSKRSIIFFLNLWPLSSIYNTMFDIFFTLPKHGGNETSTLPFYEPALLSHFLVLVFVCMMAFWLGGLTQYQFGVVTSNLTTNEMLNMDRYSHLWRTAPQVDDVDSSSSTPGTIATTSSEDMFSFGFDVAASTRRTKKSRIFSNMWDKGSKSENCLDFWFSRDRTILPHPDGGLDELEDLQGLVGGGSVSGGGVVQVVLHSAKKLVIAVGQGASSFLSSSGGSSSRSSGGSLGSLFSNAKIRQQTYLPVSTVVGASEHSDNDLAFDLGNDRVNAKIV
ncbi:unnamed protein product [Amoebophrya sp. A25]|nr:unnamed protein product [Amoebophrya sp. A25]|eukprot:GSA25T00003033001.1